MQKDGSRPGLEKKVLNSGIYLISVLVLTGGGGSTCTIMLLVAVTLFSCVGGRDP